DHPRGAAIPARADGMSPLQCSVRLDGHRRLSQARGWAFHPAAPRMQKTYSSQSLVLHLSSSLSARPPDARLRAPTFARAGARTKVIASAPSFIRSAKGGRRHHFRLGSEERLIGGEKLGGLMRPG